MRNGSVIRGMTIFIVLTLLFSGGAFLFWSREINGEQAPGDEACSQTILFVGQDRGGRADAVFLVYPRESGVKILVLPRDAYCLGGHKLNGMIRRLGPSRFIKLCSEIVGHPIESYLIVPFERLPGLFNTAFPKGITVDVPYPLKYADKAGGFAYEIPGGRQTLRGQQLVWFLRDRYSDPQGRGERARVSNWKRFLVAAFSELFKPKTLPRIPGIMRKARGTFDTNISAGSLVKLAMAYKRSPSVDVTYLPFRPVKRGRAWFVQLDKEGVRRQALLARRGILPPQDVRVLVLNGTSAPGLARTSSRHLGRSLGLHCETANAESAWITRTRVEYHAEGLKPLAMEVARTLHTRRRATPVENDWVQPTIRVVLGRDQLSVKEEGG